MLSRSDKVCNFFLKACNHLTSVSYSGIYIVFQHLECWLEAAPGFGGVQQGGCADRHPHTEQRRAVLLPTGEQVPLHWLLSGKKKRGKKP